MYKVFLCWYSVSIQCRGSMNRWDLSVVGYSWKVKNFVFDEIGFHFGDWQIQSIQLDQCSVLIAWNDDGEQSREFDLSCVPFPLQENAGDRWNRSDLKMWNFRCYEELLTAYPKCVRFLTDDILIQRRVATKQWSHIGEKLVDSINEQTSFVITIK